VRVSYGVSTSIQLSVVPAPLVVVTPVAPVPATLPVSVPVVSVSISIPIMIPTPTDREDFCYLHGVLPPHCSHVWTPGVSSPVHGKLPQQMTRQTNPTTKDPVKTSTSSTSTASRPVISAMASTPSSQPRRRRGTMSWVTGTGR
jgi:hypothetical protein